MHCYHCGTELPPNARFCPNCGKPQDRTTETAHSKTDQHYRLDFDGDVPKQITEIFFDRLAQRVREEFRAELQADYVEHLYTTNFRDTVQLRSQQLAQEAAQIQGDYFDADERLPYFLGEQLEDLLDYYIIHFCKPLNPIALPDAMLRYQNRSLRDIDPFQMTLDYLDFSNEKQTVYTDFVTMPVEKLKNASQSYLFPKQNERIFFICDQSLFGSAKEGFAMTERGLYWKAHLQPAHAVAYDDLKTLKKEKSWLVINDRFFNVNPSINLKMLKLLQKWQRLMAAPDLRED